MKRSGFGGTASDQCLSHPTLWIILPDERTLCTLASLGLSLYGGGQHV
jgi:hypothetical protein